MEPLSPPGRTGPGGGCRRPAVNGVGEPCAGEPHARFEVAGAGNGATWPWPRQRSGPQAKAGEKWLPDLTPGNATAPAPDPTHAYLREVTERAVLDQADHDRETDAGEAERGQRPAQATHASAHPGAGPLAGQRAARAHGVLRRARQPPGGDGLPRPDDPALAEGAAAPQPENPDRLDADAPDLSPVAATRPRDASLPGGALYRHSPEVGAQCGSPARWDLCGGPPARAVPTATQGAGRMTRWTRWRPGSTGEG